jgi:hypothetical protein
MDLTAPSSEQGPILETEGLKIGVVQGVQLKEMLD